MTRPGQIEREAKLEADPALELPDLDGVVAGVSAVWMTARHLDATYYDSRDLRLLTHGVTVRRRTGEGTRWTVKLAAPPPGGADASDPEDPSPPGPTSMVHRREIDIVDPATEPPAAVIELVAPWLEAAPLMPIARLVTDRRRIELRGPEGRALAEVDDDRVTVHGPDGHESAGQFHEIEIELAPDAADDPTGPVGRGQLVDAVVSRLVAAGARTGSPRSKVDRALGLLGRR